MSVCLLCEEDLREGEVQTCLKCVGQVRRNLAEIVDLYAMLPGELEHHAGERLPGGRALVALGPGSSGIGQWRAYLHGEDCSHDADEQADDGEPVAFALSRIEDDWRLYFSEPAAVVPAAAKACEHDEQRRVLTGAVGYLTQRLGRAAAERQDFDGFAVEIRQLLFGLRSITRDGPQRDVPCTKCNVPLLLEPGEDENAVPVGVYRCPKCKRRYDEAAYWVAVHQHLIEESA